MSGNNSFFINNASRLAPLELNGKAKYRECQVGAAWATLAHFTSSSEAALISMPTGSGKSALMMMLSFLLRAKRVIIVSPSVVLRGQSADKFDSLKDLKSIGAYLKAGPTPSVYDHTGQITTEKDWSKFLDYDVITVTPHTTSPGYEDIVPPPKGMFGSETILFVDEAHHSRARTWQILIESFTASPIIFLTATPFRNDNRRLLAKLIYHYPMRKAMDAGIYAPITYHSVEPSDLKEKDEKLAKTAKEIYKRHKRDHPSARLLIRAEGVKKSAELLKLYEEIGLKVAEVNYQKTLNDNSQALKDISKGKLDGIVCIDQIGEGLDIPNLKIAVLHKPRQSFPATVQFIGRISREEKQDIGKPHLIACPDDVRGPLQRLYTHDNSWHKFVPALVDKIVAKAARRSEFHRVVDVATELNLEIEDIEPFFSVRVYRGASWADPMLKNQLDLPIDIVPTYAHEITGRNMIVLITAVEKKLPWAEDADLSTPCYDLHVFYFHDKNGFLFEYTTSDKIASIIRSQLWKNPLERLDAALIAKALRESQPSRYLMFGLSSLAPDSNSIPSYKTFMGSEVEGAVRPTDAKSFTPGHALARYQTGETRGIGSFQGRVWAIKRGSLNEFKDWCDSVASCLIKKGDGRLPNVEFLPAPESITKFPANPLAMYFRPDPRDSITWSNSLGELPLEGISWDKIKLSDDKKSMKGNLCFSESDNEIDFTYSLTSPCWHFDLKDSISIKIDNGLEIERIDLAGLMEKYPPIVLLSDGSSVFGGNRYMPASQLASFPEAQLDSSRDWTGCDIQVEFEYIDPKDSSKSRVPKAGKLRVQDQLENWLKKELPKGSLLIKDHGSWEIADFVAIDPSAQSLIFYHCKACSSKKPGAGIKELKAHEQAIRSLIYIGNRGLISELVKRINDNHSRNTQLLQGSIANLEKISKNFHPNQWKHEVVVVNPGIDCKKITSYKNTNTLLINCFEWLASAGATMKIIGQ